jgi:hypothetical protein
VTYPDLPLDWNVARVEFVVYLEKSSRGDPPSYAIGHGPTLDDAIAEAIAIARRNDNFRLTGRVRRFLRSNPQETSLDSLMEDLK